MENVVYDPSTPIPIKILISTGQLEWADAIPVSRPNRNDPLMLTANVPATEESIYLMVTLSIEYLAMAPIAPPMPTRTIFCNAISYLFTYSFGYHCIYSVVVVLI